MTLKIEFETDNAAFDDINGPAEIRRILSEIAGRIVLGSVSGNIRDINGNRIGKYELTEVERC